MSYQVFARKWRPQVFEDVVGQGHITRTLQNAIVANRLAHAFLFSGPRGVGKTTTARILAKALNCVQGPTPQPCGACPSCRDTAAGAAVDVIEIDGASNRGIEHIRELRETVKYAPVGGKYKVYVIDEVHMLTNEAFNALLKTLEEPPPHVIFIFATTEPQKIPATIHSRCQRYGFKRISLLEIAAKLRDIAGAEGITISDEGLTMIARAAEGSMRDSQSLLDQSVSYSGMTISDADLQVTLGVVAQSTLLAFTANLLRKDAAALLWQVDELLERGQDMRQFLAGVAEHLRNLIVTAIAPEPGRLVELPAADIDALSRQAADAGMELLLLLFDGITKTVEELRWSPHQRFTLEIGLVRACSVGPLKPLGEALERLAQLEERLAADGPAPAPPEIMRERQAEYAPPQRAAAAPAAPGKGGGWAGIVAAVKARKPGLGSALTHSDLLEDRGTELVIGIRGSSFQKDLVEKKENKTFLEQAAGEVLGRPVSLRVQLLPDDPKSPQKPAVRKKPAPAEVDPLVQNVAAMFSGEVVESDEAPEE